MPKPIEERRHPQELLPDLASNSALCRGKQITGNCQRWSATEIRNRRFRASFFAQVAPRMSWWPVS
jgi:hypothetical protein